MSEADHAGRAGGQEVTTPGGVPNLPVGALTVDTLASKTQDMSPDAMKGRAVERFPSMMDGSTGLSPASDLTPFGILTKLFAGFNSTVANADPADVQGPDDLPGLLIDFIEEIPVVGKFVELFGAITGDYEGDDEILQAISAIFAPIRKLLQMFAGIAEGDGFPTVEQITDGVGDIFETIANVLGLDEVLELISSWKILPWQWGEDGVPLGLVKKGAQSLVAVSNFPNAASIGDNPFWSFDPDITSTADGTGSAKATADGSLKVLHSVQFPVTEGEAKPVRGRFRYRDLVATGTPLKLGVREFRTNGTQTDVTIASVPAPSGDSATANHLDFVHLSGTYTAPAGVERAWIRAIIEPGATAGEVWFDEGDADTSDEAPDWLQWLLDLFGLGGLGDAVGGDTDNIIAQFITGKLNPSQLLQDETIRQFVKGLLDTLASILRLIPFVGDDLSDSLDNFAEAMTAQNDVVIGTAAQTSQIAAALGRGVPAADDFERAALGSRWRVITSNGGTATCNGHDLVMSHDEETEFILLDLDKQAAGVYQTGEIVLGSAPGFNTVLLASARGHNDIILRADDFTTWGARKMLRARWSGQNKNLRLSAFVGGSEVVTLFNGTVATASAGSKLTLEAGVRETEQPRRYILRINGAIIPGGDIIESGTASSLTGLRRGLGGRTEKLGIGDLAVSPDPGTVKQWTATG